MADPRTVAEALDLLRELGANPWLVRHHELVAEAAAELLDGLASALELKVDRELVLVGAALHDAGKVVVPTEMSGPGHAHEAAGQELLEQRGLKPSLARVCCSHADWDRPDLPLEDLLIALADKLWKGKRVDELEMLVVSRVASKTQSTAAEVFAAVDPVFEAIAEGGDDRLSRSTV